MPAATEIRLERKPKPSLTSLPTELHLHIVAFLDWKSAAALSTTDRHFERIVDWVSKLQTQVSDLKARVEENLRCGQDILAQNRAGPKQWQKYKAKLQQSVADMEELKLEMQALITEIRGCKTHRLADVPEVQDFRAYLGYHWPSLPQF